MSLAARHRLLIAFVVIGVAAIFFVPRIAQDPGYHQFADMLTLLSIPNALNVLTNLFFAWVGIEGLYRLVRLDNLTIEEQIRPVYLIFFISLILVALGSGYYHLSPDNLSLVWDRLPMTIAFMSFFTILCAERLSLGLARKIFPLLLAVGIASVVYWHFSEQAGRGDLRPYVLVQFLPILLTPLILLLFPSRFDRSSDIWWFLAWYAASKLFEWLDTEIYELLIVISGHSLKHVAAAIGCLVFLRHFRLRKPSLPGDTVNSH
jgi:hypothetical protein